jgi:hypothetical protein
MNTDKAKVNSTVSATFAQTFMLRNFFAMTLPMCVALDAALFELEDIFHFGVASQPFTARKTSIKVLQKDY